MAEQRMFYANEGSKYGEGIVLDEYKGSFSLISARKKNDEVYLEWVFPQARDGSRKPIEKSIPWKVTLGDREAAIKTLRAVLVQLGASDPGDPAPDGSEDSIPF